MDLHLKAIIYILICLVVEIWSKECRLSRRNLSDDDSLDAALQKCDSKIEYLALRNNHITKVDLKMFKRFQHLKILLLDGNNLQDIPTKFNDNLPTLRHLSLSGNRIEHIPASFEASNLTILDLSKNNISYLPPKSFSEVTRLTSLFLSQNKIHKISIDAFAGLKDLKKLDLDRNDIDTLYHGILNDLKSLQTFSAAHNKIERIRNGVLTNLRYLNDIILNDNKISILDGRSFQRLLIHQLNLQNNRLKSLKDSVFLNSLIYGKIDVRGNPLDCDCWLFEQNTAKLNSMGELQGACMTPSELNGRNIATLTRDQLSCKTTNSCREHECANNGFCKHINETSYECQCLPSFYGERCQNIKQSSSYTLLIILSVGLGLVFTIIVIVFVIVRIRRNRNVHNRCISKETCCCFSILGVFFFLFALFVGLRVACKFHEYC